MKGGRQQAILVMGPESSGGVRSTVSLPAGVSVPRERPVIIDEHGEVVLDLHPFVLFMRPCPGEAEELFFLDRAMEGRPVYRSVTSRAEYRATAPIPSLTGLVSEERLDPVRPGSRPFRGLMPFAAHHHRMYFGHQPLCIEIFKMLSNC